MATAQPVVDPANPHNLDFLPEPEELGDIENPKETRCASFSVSCTMSALTFHFSTSAAATRLATK